MARTIGVSISDEQYELARRRAFVEDLKWKHIWNALINAYIAGDITVTQQGRYSIHPPKAAIPVVHVRHDADLIELEPDWSINDPRPQVGADSTHQQSKHKGAGGWGTTHLHQYIKQETGRKIPKQYLRRLLKALEIPKSDNGRWYFKGPTDPKVETVISAIETGVYDEITRLGLEHMLKSVAKSHEHEVHDVQHAETKRQRFIERLKQMED